MMGFVLLTENILHSLVDVNSKAFLFADSFVQPVGGEISPRILVRGDWRRDRFRFRFNLPKENMSSMVGHDRKLSTCTQMIGWGDESKWNFIGKNYFHQAQQVEQYEIIPDNAVICSQFSFSHSNKRTD